MNMIKKLKFKLNKKTFLLGSMLLFVALSVMNNIHIIEGLENENENENDNDNQENVSELNMKNLDASIYDFDPFILSKIIQMFDKYHKQIMDKISNDAIQDIQSSSSETLKDIRSKITKYQEWNKSILKLLDSRNKFIIESSTTFNLDLRNPEQKSKFNSFLKDVDNSYKSDNDKISQAASSVYRSIDNLFKNIMNEKSDSIKSFEISRFGDNMKKVEEQYELILSNINIVSEKPSKLSISGK